jgi:hypothetical protein
MAHPDRASGAQGLQPAGAARLCPTRPGRPGHRHRLDCGVPARSVAATPPGRYRHRSHAGVRPDTATSAAGARQAVGPLADQLRPRLRGRPPRHHRGDPLRRFPGRRQAPRSTSLSSTGRSWSATWPIYIPSTPAMPSVRAATSACSTSSSTPSTSTAGTATSPRR